MKKDCKYDVIIIGAGIGGLVCGCYLSKAGFNVLIVEQHTQPGGYCTSFKRNGFVFDVGVHYLGSCSKGRTLYKIFNELNVYNDITFNRKDPSDIIILPDLEVAIMNNNLETAEALAKNFPLEKDKIFNFFQLINEKNFLKVYYEIHDLTFKQVLDKYFKNKRLKAFFQVLLGNVGLASEDVAALTAIVMYRQFVFDGGYYPLGSMQKIPDLLAKEFQKTGGTLLLSSKVTGLNIKDDIVSSILIGGDRVICAKNFVFNADPRKIIEMSGGKNCAPSAFLTKLHNLKSSVSAFILYLGVSAINLKRRSSIWYFNTEDIDNIYKKAYRNIFDVKDDYVICTFPSFHDPSLAPVGYDSMSLIIAAPYAVSQNKFDWNRQKEMISNVLLDRFKQRIFPSLGDIKVKIAATPYTLERYTNNGGGALYGWASTLSQIDQNIMPYQTDIGNLFLVGHWATSGLGQGGITGVANSGRIVARLIAKKDNFKAAAVKL